MKMLSIYKNTIYFKNCVNLYTTCFKWYTFMKIFKPARVKMYSWMPWMDYCLHHFLLILVWQSGCPVQLTQTVQAFFTGSIMKGKFERWYTLQENIWSNHIICQHFNKLATLDDKRTVPIELKKKDFKCLINLLKYVVRWNLLFTYGITVIQVDFENGVFWVGGFKHHRLRTEPQTPPLWRSVAVAFTWICHTKIFKINFAWFQEQQWKPRQ